MLRLSVMYVIWKFHLLALVGNSVFPISIAWYDCQSVEKDFFVLKSFQEPFHVYCSCQAFFLSSRVPLVASKFRDNSVNRLLSIKNCYFSILALLCDLCMRLQENLFQQLNESFQILILQLPLLIYKLLHLKILFFVKLAMILIVYIKLSMRISS